METTIETKKNIFGKEVQCIFGFVKGKNLLKKEGYTFQDGYNPFLWRGNERWSYNSWDKVWVKAENI